MDKEVLELIRILSVQHILQVKDVERMTQASRRQIDYRIEKINQLLIDYHLPPIYIQNQMIIADPVVKEFLLEYTFSDLNQSEYYLNRIERQQYIFIWMYINSEYLSVQHITQQLSVSKTTLMNDMNDLSELLKKEGVDIHYNRSLGYYLKGSEHKKQKMMVKMVANMVTHDNTSQVLPMILNDFDFMNFNLVKKVFNNLAKKQNINFVETRLKEFIYIFLFESKRLSSSTHKLIQKQSEHINLTHDLKEYYFIKQLISYYHLENIFGEEDIEYLVYWILGVSIGDINEETADREMIYELVCEIVANFERLSGTAIVDSTSLIEHIYSHFRPAFYRITNDIPIDNPLTMKIVNRYEGLIMIVREIFKSIQPLKQYHVSLDELSLMALHFSTVFLQDNQIKDLKKIRALIVCLNGIGSSVILYNELRTMFSEFEFYPPISAYDLSQISGDFDIIFTTNIVEEMIDSDKPVVKVSPVMSVSEKRFLYRQVYSALINHEIYKKEDNVQSILKKNHIDDALTDKLTYELTQYFTHKIEGKLVFDFPGQLKLEEMVYPHYILLKLEASHDEDAIKKIGQVLLDDCVIDREYIEAMIKRQRSHPNYFVIALGVAFPHAQPFHGVHKDALVICTLAKPVTFGEEKVSKIFMLAATNNNSHLNAMGELLDLINNEEFMSTLDDTEDISDIYRFIINKEGH